MSGVLEGPECLRVVRHLLGGCPSCRALASDAWSAAEDARLGKALRPEAPRPRHPR